MVLEAPLITESALEVIRKYCEDEVRPAAERPLSPRWQGQEPCSLQPVAGPGPRVGPEGHPAETLWKGVCGQVQI